MRCPFCNSEDTKVVDSRSFMDGFSIKRRRECIKCEKRFTTYEKIEETPKDSVLDSLKDKHVEEVEFSVRTANFLISSDLKTLDKVALKTDADLLRLIGANEMIIEEIKEKLAEYNAHLGMRG